MKKMFVLLFSLGMALTAYSQTITIKDERTGKPLDRVSLISENPDVYTSTNSRGQADITPFKGSGRILICRSGYETLEMSYAELAASSFELSIPASPLHRHEVVVSATRWRQDSSEVPSTIITILPEETALQNPQTAADLLGVSGKVFIQKSQQGGGSPMIRGFATNRLLYTVDGVRMNTAIFRGGNIQNVISLDPWATESTEVCFGSRSLIYGSDAIGGVMSFQTLTPQLSFSNEPLVTGKAAARFSSANEEKSGHFDVNVGWRKWAMVTSFSSFDYDHLRQGRNGPDDYLKPQYVQRQDEADTVIAQDDPLLQIPSAYSQQNVMQKLRFMPSDQWDFQFGFHYSETSPYGRYDRHNRLRNGLPRYAEWNYGPQKWMMNNLSVMQNRGGLLYDQMTIRLAKQSFEESRIDRSMNQDIRNIRTEEVGAWSANLDFLKSIGDADTLCYGVEYVRDDVTSTGVEEDISTGSSVPGPSRYPQAVWQSFAAYVSDQHELSRRFMLQAGLRYNRFILDADFDTSFYPFPFTTAHLNKGALTGSIGGVYRPSDFWTLRANVGTAFRSPNVDDMGKVFDSEPGAVVIPNPDLDAEYAWNFDLGVSRVFGEIVKADLTGYYTSLQNAMVRRDFTLDGQDHIMYDGVWSRVQAIQNAAVADVYGIQAGLEAQLPAGFGFSSDFNFQEGEEELDDGTLSPSRHAAPWFGVSRLTYATGKLNLQFYAVYQGERRHEDLAEEEQGKDEIYAADENGNTYAPGWYTLNFKAIYRMSEHWSISSGIENLTDQRYRPYSSGISGPGRNMVLSLRANF